MVLDNNSGKRWEREEREERIEGFYTVFTS
jgi:hypothetical protein